MFGIPNIFECPIVSVKIESCERGWGYEVRRRWWGGMFRVGIGAYGYKTVPNKNEFDPLPLSPPNPIKKTLNIITHFYPHLIPH